MPIPFGSVPKQPISLGPANVPTQRSISNEFGEAQPTHSLSQFYRGGSFVANHPINNGIPTSGSIAMSQFDGSSIVLKYNIQSNIQNLDLYSYATSGSRQTGQPKSQGYMVNERYISGDYGIEFQIGPGVEITTASRTQASITTGTGWEPGAQIRLINQGLILGGGGGGGNGGQAGPLAIVAPQPGQSGGTAIDAQRPITIDNIGTIAGGGGGGGGGGATAAPGSPPKAIDPFSGGGGGGGAGQVVGTGGVALQPYTNPQGLPGNGQPGQPNAGGNGGPGEPGVGFLLIT